MIQRPSGQSQQAGKDYQGADRLLCGCDRGKQRAESLQCELGMKSLKHRFNDGGKQDHESPENEEMHQACHWIAQKFGLGEGYGQNISQPVREEVESKPVFSDPEFPDEPGTAIAENPKGNDDEHTEHNQPEHENPMSMNAAYWMPDAGFKVSGRKCTSAVDMTKGAYYL